MPSNAARGASAKARTKRWAAGRGYQVVDLELVRNLYTPRGIIPTKRDQVGSDLLLMDAETIIFVQVKSEAAATGETYPDARRKFAEFRFPPFAQRWVVVWARGAHAPRIIDASDDTAVLIP